MGRGHAHRALVGELDGVAEEVDQHLPQAGAVGVKHLGHAVVDLKPQFQPLGGGLGRDHRHGVFKECANLERLRIEFELARLQLGEIQDVVDHTEQGVSA